jgi:L-threonylcarbamoyladenylate synthase
MITNDIELVCNSLKNGEIVGLPTETVYGLAASIFNEAAIERIYSKKNRPRSNPLIVHVAALDQAKLLVKEFPLKAELLARHFWPGPITLILPKSDLVNDVVTANSKSVAIRVPNHKMTLNLLGKLNFPLAAPSANPYNRISPTCAEHVESYFPDINILDGGECQSGLESTILSFEENEVVLLRHGAIPIESIEALIGSRILTRTSGGIIVNSPGMNKKHYAPLCELILTYEPLFMISVVKNKKVGILWFKKVQIYSAQVQVNKILAPSGSFEEASKNMYALLHDLEKQDLDLIIVERLPDHGLGRTLNDRLIRASSK